MVIPNIQEEKTPKQTAAKKSQTQEAASMDVSVDTGSNAPKEPSVVVENHPSALQKTSEALYASAKEVWNNAVVLADQGQKFIRRTIFRPNVAFAALPENWKVTEAWDNDVSVPAPQQKPQQKLAAATSAEALAKLAPAAGEPTTPVPAEQQPPQPQAVPAPITPSPEPIPAAQANTPVKAAAPVAAAPPAADPSEPAPTLSSQSKAILAKLPQMADPKVKETPKNVAITRGKPTTTDLSGKASAAAEEPKNLGLSIGSASVKMDTSYELGRAYDALVAGNSDIAIGIYEDILTSAPTNEDALFGLASTYHRAGQIDKARALYGKLLELNPKHRDGLNNFLVLLSEEAPQEALAQMERLEEQNPGFSPIPAQMAIIYQKLGLRDKAVDKMYRALAISPENVTYRYNLAIMLDKNGNYERAAELYTQILQSAAKGETIPGDANKIQQRLTFIRSNIRR